MKYIIIGSITLIIRTMRYCPESMTTILWTYTITDCSEKVNELKLDDDGITPMENSVDTKTSITLKNHHRWGCPVYVLDARLQGTIYCLPEW